MLTMDQKQQILHHYRVDEDGLREISRKVGVDRKTVRRLIQAFEERLTKDPDLGMEEFLAERPKYKKRDYYPRTLTHEITKEIDKWLKENERRRSMSMRKQCLKRQDIHRQLIEKGMNVSYSSVCKYIARKKSEKTDKTKEAYLRIHREPGAECEFDWGEVKLCIDGRKEVLTMAVFAFPHSKGRRAYLFHRQDTLAFMESHRNFFRQVHGVPYVMVYDNMKVAVVLDEKKKFATEALQRMASFYKFQWRFCNARAGWEKGNVERSVDYVRGRAFTTRIDFATLQEAQQWLDMICDQINSEVGSNATVDKLCEYAEELAALQPYPGEIGCFELAEYKVDKQSTICIKHNHYSVPDHLLGERVIVKLYSEKVVIFDSKHVKVATHERSYGLNQWRLDITHYINTLMKKTAALEHTEALRQMPSKMQNIFHKHFRNNGKDFLQLLKFAKENDYTYDDIIAAADIVSKRGAKRLSSDVLKVALHSQRVVDEPFRDDQKTDEFLEIEMGSDDILSQLESAMEKGTKLENKDEEDLGNE